MKKPSAKARFDMFFSEVGQYTDLLEKVYTDKDVISTAQEKKQVFEAFVVLIYVSWELLVQGILIDCLTRDTSQYAKYTETPLPKHLNRNVCKSLLTGLAFFPSASDVKKTAQDVLVPQHNPFKEISNGCAKKIEEFRLIRNYLAHRSDSAKRKLRTIYERSYHLKRFQEPGDFLFTKVGSKRRNGMIRFATYIKSFYDAAVAMAEFLGV